jgi:hypothetical protein
MIIQDDYVFDYNMIMLPWRSMWNETDVPRSYSTNHGVTQVREL